MSTVGQAGLPTARSQKPKAFWLLLPALANYVESDQKALILRPPPPNNNPAAPRAIS
jgi:hypothetical protein